MNRKLLQQLESKQIEVNIVRVEEPEEAVIEESELDAPVELCQQQEEPALALARARPENWSSFSICIRSSQR
ncbi:MAG: hypothetical protein JO235_02595 [Chroococcidiopsidaceae cyanobacterium CP_BM_RX_35]|nr:hypothetical protein [Chroococcidiopsidaceae cyanobacterium CP_BM_RX_35]